MPGASTNHVTVPVSRTVAEVAVTRAGSVTRAAPGRAPLPIATAAIPAVARRTRLRTTVSRETDGDPSVPKHAHVTGSSKRRARAMTSVNTANAMTDRIAAVSAAALKRSQSPSATEQLAHRQGTGDRAVGACT